MTVFSYGFGFAISIAMGIAIGSSWVRDNRAGVWSKKLAFSITISVLLFGIILGWAIDTWLSWAFSAPGHRVY